MTTDIGKLPTQKQLEWLDDNRGDIVSAAWGEDCRGWHRKWSYEMLEVYYLYAIMHKVTEAVDQHIGPVIGNAKNGDWWHPNDNSGRNGHAASYPTRFQAELAALGAPEEVVNDG